MLTVGSCFAGIGGIDRGLEATGAFKTIWQIENNPYASAVLAKHWPDAKRYGDIRSIDVAGLERVDVICGGYPCQPFSLAGRRGGENDPRHLWPDMFRLIRALRPRLVLLENVPGHLSLGFGEVLGDLASIGFDAEWGLLSAAGVGAPHLRKRLFVVAHAERPERRTLTEGRHEPDWNDTGREETASGLGERRQDVADSKGAECEGSGTEAWRRGSQPRRGGWWATEPNVGRVAHGVPSRVDRLKCLGNAVVPQVAQKVGEMILESATR